MKCRCGASLGQVNRAGEPIVRTSGLVLKGEGGMALVCPKCKADVPFTADFAKALQTSLALFFKR